MHLLRSPLFILLAQPAFSKAIPRYRDKGASEDLNFTSQPEWRHSQDTITSPHNDATATEPAYKSRPCSLSISQTQELYSPILTTYGWEATINVIAGESRCRKEYEIHPTTEDFSIECDVFEYHVTVHFGAHDVLDFKFGEDVWTSDDEKRCQSSGWVQDHENAVSIFSESVI